MGWGGWWCGGKVARTAGLSKSSQIYISFPNFLIGYLVVLWIITANENMTSSYYKLSLYRQIIYVNTARSWFIIYFPKSYDWLLKLWLFVTANENIHLNTARS